MHKEHVQTQVYNAAVEGGRARGPALVLARDRGTQYDQRAQDVVQSAPEERLQQPQRAAATDDPGRGKCRGDENPPHMRQRHGEPRSPCQHVGACADPPQQITQKKRHPLRGPTVGFHRSALMRQHRQCARAEVATGAVKVAVVHDKTVYVHHTGTQHDDPVRWHVYCE